MRIKS